MRTKISSLEPTDKRRLSILNTNFKLYEGLISRRFRKLGDRILSPLQYAGGKNRKIHHGKSRARDAITKANESGIRGGIGDQDYIMAFDFLVLDWVWLVLEKKGL